jgi:SAM-dependent methyltransferase
MPWLYDGLMSLADGLGFARWRRALVRTARGCTLEVGCGTGRNLPLYPSGVFVVGLDPDPRSLARARWRAPHVPLVAARAEALPFRAGTFDTVVSSLVFCSVDDPAQGLREIRRVFQSSGGRFCRHGGIRQARRPRPAPPLAGEGFRLSARQGRRLTPAIISAPISASPGGREGDQNSSACLPVSSSELSSVQVSQHQHF